MPVFEDQIRSIVIDLLVLLADGDYESIMERCAGSRVSGDDLQAAVRDYGRTVIAPPADYKFFRTWSVEADVWTEEQGASDLTLQLTIAFEPDGPLVEIDGLNVL